MRKLTSKQKKLLNIYYDKSKSLPGFTPDIEFMPSELWHKLEAINNTEILWQEVNRYLMDKHFENI